MEHLGTLKGHDGVCVAVERYIAALQLWEHIKFILLVSSLTLPSFPLSSFDYLHRVVTFVRSYHKNSKYYFCMNA